MMSLQTIGQETILKTQDPENGSLVYQGRFGFDDLRQEPAFSWFAQGAASYQPDKGSVEMLRRLLPGHKLVVFLGTWCEDSQIMIPRLYKTLQLAGYPLDSLEMIGANRAKETLGDEGRRYGLEKVPTVIVLKDGRERGRIVELVHRSIEQDLAAILRPD